MSGIVEVPAEEILSMQNEILDFCMKKGFKTEATCFALVALGLKVAMEKSPDYDEAPYELFDAAIGFIDWMQENDPLNGPVAGSA